MNRNYFWFFAEKGSPTSSITSVNSMTSGDDDNTLEEDCLVSIEEHRCDQNPDENALCFTKAKPILSCWTVFNVVMCVCVCGGGGGGC